MKWRVGFGEPVGDPGGAWFSPHIQQMIGEDRAFACRAIRMSVLAAEPGAHVVQWISHRTEGRAILRNPAAPVILHRCIDSRQQWKGLVIGEDRG
jgi:hypothetical protein